MKLSGPLQTKRRARELRRRMSEPEVLLWQHLRGSPAGLRFRRQHPAGPYVLDFFCAKARLVVEVDGEQHGLDEQRWKDERRDRYLNELGYGVLRVPAVEIRRDASGAADMIVQRAIELAPTTTASSGGPPPPEGKEGVGLQPASGTFGAGIHRFPIRVYFEDTDLSGIVYHANYLRFMERARSDMLRLAGIDQRAAFEAGEGVYAVADLSIQYKRPAKLDDVLIVESRVRRVRAAATEIEQLILRGGELITRGLVIAALVAPDGKPVRQPAEWRALFTELMQADPDGLPEGDHAG